MKRQDKEVKLSRKDFVTNYPHFRYWKKNAVPGLAGMNEESVNIYLHVPFCMQKCEYCYYLTETLTSRDQLDVYVDALCRELAMASWNFGLSRRRVESIYIGGGTPSLLQGDMLKKIVQALHDNFAIDNPEFTLEAEPRTITAQKVNEYKEIGIDRISIGVQSFVDEIIALSGRKHSAEKALSAIDAVHDAGDIVINIDLLSGLAGETMETWEKTLDTAVKTRAHNITIYKMEVYLNTEFFKKSVRKKLLELPSEEQELEFMKAAVQRFDAAYYKPWSTFTFGRDGGGFQHRYITNLWHGGDCCAVGPSAFGNLGPYNYQNTGYVDSYLAMIDEGKLSAVRGYKLTSKDIMVRDVLLALKFKRFERASFVRKHGFDFLTLLQDAVAKLQAEGFIILDDEALTLTAKGILYGDYVAKKLAMELRSLFGEEELSLY